MLIWQNCFLSDKSRLFIYPKYKFEEIYYNFIFPIRYNSILRIKNCRNRRKYLFSKYLSYFVVWPFLSIDTLSRLSTKSITWISRGFQIRERPEIRTIDSKVKQTNSLLSFPQKLWLETVRDKIFFKLYSSIFFLQHSTISFIFFSLLRFYIFWIILEKKFMKFKTRFFSVN